jgi:hypothetical protein
MKIYSSTVMILTERMQLTCDVLEGMGACAYPYLISSCPLISPPYIPLTNPIGIHCSRRQVSASRGTGKAKGESWSGGTEYI